ncbi:hypothetical protein [Actibacterium sp.]|uniref:hypothetical protein n=1 Tax=Actibacterium sp. TaxID=1872125 RepID=UPI003562AF54
MTTALTLEDIYEALATTIDAVGPAQSEVYLAKVALALAHELKNPARALQMVTDCAADLD